MPNSLRLTLRTLLSYLDDTLDPAQARVIGQKVAESEQARELMDRIRQVTRRRRLTTPPATGPGGIDANTIAEYLDNEVTPEQAVEVEQICQASDVHLAEVAACHQILTLVLGEPALVPPSARQRMYGLVKGPEAIPFRKPPKQRSEGDLDLSTSDAGHEDETLRPGGGSSDTGMRNTLLLAAGGLIAVGLLIFALWQLFGTGNQPAKDNPVVQNDKKDKDDKKDADIDKKQSDDSKDKDDKKQPDDKKDKDDKIQPDDKKKDDDKKDKDDKKAPPGKDLGSEPIPFDPPLLKPAAILGEYLPNPKEPDVLLHKGPGEKGTWERLWINNREIGSGRPLMALPSMRSDIRLKTGVMLTLWGTSPEVWPNPLFYESLAELYPHPVLDLDLTLKRGKILLRNAKKFGKPAVIRIRFDDPMQQKQLYFDVTLRGKDTVVAVERFSALPPEPFFDDRQHPNRKGPFAVVICLFMGGNAYIRSPDSGSIVETQKGPQFVAWSSIRGFGSPDAARPEMTDFYAETPKFGEPKERKLAIDAGYTLAVNLVSKKLDVALQEALDSNSVASRRLAVRCYTALDEFGVPLELLDRENTNLEFEDLRRTALYSLLHWLPLERDNEYRVFDALRAQYKPIVARKVMELLHSMPPEEREKSATWQRLIDDLDNPVVILRALSAYQLELALPKAAQRINQKLMYTPAAPPGVRRAAMAAWRDEIRPGSVPKKQ
jgi:hypothetical protein